VNLDAVFIRGSRWIWLVNGGTEQNISRSLNDLPARPRNRNNAVEWLIAMSNRAAGTPGTTAHVSSFAQHTWRDIDPENLASGLTAHTTRENLSLCQSRHRERRNEITPSSRRHPSIHNYDSAAGPKFGAKLA
jgi:hypothetical protein